MRATRKPVLSIRPNTKIEHATFTMGGNSASEGVRGYLAYSDGRMIHLEMSTSEARSIGRRLIETADQVDQWQADKKAKTQ